MILLKKTKINRQIKIKLQRPNGGVESIEISLKNFTTLITMKKVPVMSTQINNRRINCIMKTNIPVKDKRSLKMARNIMVVSFKDSVMDTANAFLPMVASTKVIGKTDKSMEKERWYGLMADFIKANGQNTTYMEMESMFSLAGLFIKDYFIMILNMDLELIPGLMDKAFMAIGNRISLMESVYLAMQRNKLRK